MRLLLGVLLLSVAMCGQELSAPLAPRTDGKLSVFVGDSETFYSSSFGTAAGRTAVQSSQAGSMKFTVLVMKEIDKRCANVVVVNRPDLAEYFVRFEVNASLFVFRPGMAVFNRSGDMVFVDTSANYTKEVKHLCEKPPFLPRGKK